MAFAHTLPGRGPAEWEPLAKHLNDVAEVAAQFADAFIAKKWGHVLGHWHDLGKYSIAFQDYLHQSNDYDASEEVEKPGRVDHSTFGAQHARVTTPGLAGQLIAFCIAGHHAGLADAMPANNRASLSFRWDSTKNVVPPVTLPPNTLELPVLSLPWRSTMATTAETGFALSFFGRMLFSCLIDADRTATEAFCDRQQAEQRSGTKPTLALLQAALDDFLTAKQKAAPPTPVNAIRAKVLVDCLKASILPAGFFSLNVPTGGGKTFASLAFAFHHAAAHSSLRRVVVAIPFTSIIEQTADQYRAALGPLAETGLIEHHSNLNPKHDTRQNKLAAENWDAPLIVTTNVQLYESLFAAKTTPARKLHRLANSVIILDEAQTIPVDLLAPTLMALKELVARYGCTIVLCTATQPALEWREKEFEIGIQATQPIIANAGQLHESLRRVTVERLLGKVDDSELVARLAAESQVLCVVNTKAHAAKLYDALSNSGESECFHLSTFMCPQHRRDVLVQIREILNRNAQAIANGEPTIPCRVISTQLIEAGVDVDFPCVYRAAAGFDSIAQSAGRCNREGKLCDADGQPALGRVYVFDAEIPPPKGLLRSAAETAGKIADLFPDPIVPAAIERYFSLFYWGEKRDHNWDSHGVLECFDFNPNYYPAHRELAPFQYRTASERYQIIRDEQTPVLVPYNDTARSLIDRLMTGADVDYDFYKVAQQYSVGVRDQLLQQLGQNANLLQHEASGLWYLANAKAYSPKKGLLANVAGVGADAFIL